MALNIGQIGENLALGSATIVKAGEGEAICGLCHPRFFFFTNLNLKYIIGLDGQRSVVSPLLKVFSNLNLNAIIDSSGASGDVQYGRYAALLSFKGNAQG